MAMLPGPITGEHCPTVSFPPNIRGGVFTLDTPLYCQFAEARGYGRHQMRPGDILVGLWSSAYHFDGVNSYPPRYRAIDGFLGCPDHCPLPVVLVSWEEPIRLSDWAVALQRGYPIAHHLVIPARGADDTVHHLFWQARPSVAEMPPYARVIVMPARRQWEDLYYLLEDSGREVQRLAADLGYPLETIVGHLVVDSDEMPYAVVADDLLGRTARRSAGPVEATFHLHGEMTEAGVELFMQHLKSYGLPRSTGR
jgi:hypothetical protein